MSIQRQLLNFTPLTWMTLVNGAALVAFAASPHAVEYPLALLSILAFMIIPIVLPACRLNGESPLCPGNLAQVFFWCQLVLVPVTIGYYGIALGTLPRLPSDGAMNTAICLRIVAYVAFSVGYQIFSKAPEQTDQVADEAAARDFSPLVILAFAGIGMLGWVLHYGGVAGFLEYATAPLVQRERAMEETTLTNAAGGILRHFLGFTVVWAWSVWISRTDDARRLPMAVLVTAFAVVLLLVANFAYNRGTLLAPLLALAAAFSAHVRRLSFGLVALAGVVILAGAFVAGWYRTTNLQISDLADGNVAVDWEGEELVSSVQIYGAGPQLTAFLVDELEMSNHSYHRATLLSSLLYPIPILGKDFRPQSGVYLFNEMIYGDPTVLDQNLAYDAELFMNFHVFGVIIGYFALGWLQSFLQARFQQAEAPVESYLWLFVSIWTCFPGSLPVLSQLCIYTFWPIYGYLFFKFMLRPRGDACAVRSLPAVKGMATS